MPCGVAPMVSQRSIFWDKIGTNDDKDLRRVNREKREEDARKAGGQQSSTSASNCNYWHWNLVLIGCPRAL